MKPLRVRREVVRRWCDWLVTRGSATLDTAALDALPEDDVPEKLIKNMEFSGVEPGSIEGYCACAEDAKPLEELDECDVRQVGTEAAAMPQSSAIASHAAKALIVKTSSEPICEYGNDYLYDVFPDLFPNRQGGPPAKCDKREWLGTMVKRGEPYASTPSFVLDYTNLFLRQEWWVRARLEMIRHPGNANATENDVFLALKRLSGVARDEELTATARTLVSSTRTTAGHVPGAPGSNKKTQNDVFAAGDHFGGAAVYLTINPPDKKSVDLDRLVDTCGGGHRDARPVLSTTYFWAVFDSFLKHGLGWDGDKFNAADGVMGDVQAAFASIETNARGSLHAHLLIWVRELGGSVLADATASEEIAAKAVAFIDSIVCTQVDEEHQRRRVKYELDCKNAAEERERFTTECADAKKARKAAKMSRADAKQEVAAEKERAAEMGVRDDQRRAEWERAVGQMQHAERLFEPMTDEAYTKEKEFVPEHYVDRPHGVVPIPEDMYYVAGMENRHIHTSTCTVKVDRRRASRRKSRPAAAQPAVLAQQKDKDERAECRFHFKRALCAATKISANGLQLRRAHEYLNSYHPGVLTGIQGNCDITIVGANRGALKSESGTEFNVALAYYIMKYLVKEDEVCAARRATLLPARRRPGTRSPTLATG